MFRTWSGRSRPSDRSRFRVRGRFLFPPAASCSKTYLAADRYPATEEKQLGYSGEKSVCELQAQPSAQQ